MLAIDIVKPEPTTEAERYERWKNRLQSELQSMPGYGKRIKVKYIDGLSCSGQGSKYCQEQGKHSWFNHAMDTYH